MARPLIGAPRVRVGLLAAYGALAALAVCAAVGFLVAGGTGASERADRRPWSQWAPRAETERQRLDAIAQHVGAAYGRRLQRAGGLVLEQGVLDRQPGLSGSLVLFRGGRVSLEPLGLPYFGLCGMGRGCRLALGRRTLARGRTLRRLALELSLYTLRYTRAERVRIILPAPPPLPAREREALYLEREQARSLLARPLAETLSELDADPSEELLLPHLYRLRSEGGPEESRPLTLILEPLLETLDR
jgi:hypothetical protein